MRKKDRPAGRPAPDGYTGAMHPGNDLTLGTHPAAGEPVRLSREARGKHLYVVGTTGAGKSKFLEGLIRQDVLAWPHSGCGLLLLDPHGKLFDDLMQFIAAGDLDAGRSSRSTCGGGIGW